MSFQRPNRNVLTKTIMEAKPFLSLLLQGYTIAIITCAGPAHEASMGPGPDSSLWAFQLRAGRDSERRVQPRQTDAVDQFVARELINRFQTSSSRLSCGRYDGGGTRTASREGLSGGFGRALGHFFRFHSKISIELL